MRCPFIEENSDGEIDHSGNIIWRDERIVKRTAKATFEQENV